MRILRNVLFCILFPLSLCLLIGGIGFFIVGFIMNATGLGTDTAFFRFFDEPLTGGLTIFGSLIAGGIMIYLSFLLDPDFSSTQYTASAYTPPAPVHRPPTDNGIHGSVTIGGSHSRQSGSPAPSAPARPTAPPTAQPAAPYAPSVPLDPFALDTGSSSWESIPSSDVAEEDTYRHGRLEDGGYTVGAYEYDRDGNMTGYTTESGNHYDEDGEFTGYDVDDRHYDCDGNETGYRVGDTEYDADGQAIGYYTPSGTFYELD